MKKNNYKFYIITECPYVGVIRSILNLANFIKKYNFEIEFILPKEPRNRYGENQKENELELKKFGKISYLPMRRKTKYLVTDSFFLIKKLKNNEKKIIISITEYAGYLSRILYIFKNKNTKIIHSHQCLDLKRKNGLSYIKHYFLENFFKNMCDYYLACSHSELNILKKFLKIKKEKIILLRNYLMNSEIINDKNNNFYHNKYKFIYTGRIVKEKKINTILETFQNLNILNKLFIVGEGNLLNKYKNNYPKANFLGRMKHNDLLNYLNNFSFFVSASKIEGLSYSLLEAMSRGLIPIVSNIPGHNDIVIENYNGFLFLNKKEFIKKIKNINNLNMDKLVKISNNAQRTSNLSSSISEIDFKNFIKIINLKYE